MPWRETWSAEERLEFVQDWYAGGLGIAALCRQYGVSRRTGYKWLKRYSADQGLESLRDRSSKPRSNSRAVDPSLEGAIVAARKVNTTYGPRKLRAMLALLNPNAVLPAASTFGMIFRRNGLIRPRKRRPHVPPSTQPFASCASPNDVWCADFKGHFGVGGRACHPLTIMDAHSRYLIRCEALRRTDTRAVLREFGLAFSEFGMPAAIRTDNGPPFASTGAGGLSRLSVWWIKLGIRPERIEPGKPQQNGRHERMHRTLKLETATPPEGSLAAQQRAFDRFRKRYNDDRPHEALGQKPPSTVYVPSSRAFPSDGWRPKDPEYTFELEAHRVDEHGNLRWRGRSVYLSIALAHELVALRRAADDIWEVHFGPVQLGTMKAPQRKKDVVRLVRPATVLPTSSV